MYTDEQKVADEIIEDLTINFDYEVALKVAVYIVGYFQGRIAEKELNND